MMKIYYKLVTLIICLLFLSNGYSQCVPEQIDDITFSSFKKGDSFIFQVRFQRAAHSGIDYEDCASKWNVIFTPPWISTEFLGPQGNDFSILNYKVTTLSDNLDDLEREGSILFGVDYSENILIKLIQPSEVIVSEFVEEYINHVSSENYDITGKIVSKSRVYFDEFGKGIQSQFWDVKTKKVWATQTEYDAQGRPALATSAAPIGINFKYKADFIKDANGNVFNEADLGSITIDPSTVSSAANTLGEYYSESTTEKYQDITGRPYSRTFYDELNPGNVLKVVGGNKVDTTGDGTPDSFPQGFSYTMPAAQELFYAFGKEAFLEIMNTPASAIETALIQKTVNIDSHGVEVVSFQSAEGQVLATARSGEGPQKFVMSMIGPQGYVDIHLPKGCDGSIDFFGDDDTDYKVFDLKTSKEVTNKSNIPAGIYRIEALNTDITALPTKTAINSTGAISSIVPNAKGLIYKTNYYDYSLNYYDNVGNLKSSLPAIGFNNEIYNTYNLSGTASHINKQLMNYYKYDSNGNLIYVQDPDLGISRFKYRSDGQIRFSQNSKQQDEGELSYTNYDSKGRAVESGVYNKASESLFSSEISSPLDAILDNVYTYEQYITSQDVFLENKYCKEIQFTLYDKPDNIELESAFRDDDRIENYANQSFTEGRVSKSYTINPTTSTTWYSYDVYGRVTWMVQKISGLLGVNTIDYEYDDITGAVSKVYYQKDLSGEQFIHRYTYDPDDGNLTRVETATNNAGPYTTHADYKYYENGNLKRTELAQGLQGIDYVYTINGSLKAINHPSLEAANDPGKDTNDVFGMHIDYYKGDYSRPGVAINASNLGTNQYNGNIKAVRWNNKATDEYTENEKSYAYHYNRNNWLTTAEFNQGEGSKPQALVVKENVNISSNVTASEEILLNEGVTITGTSSLITLSISDEEQEVGSDDYKVSNITYDANGNIQSLNRNKNTESGNNQMDDLKYHYNESRPNQLAYIEDKVNRVTNADDIKSQDLNNYVYNSIGQLVENTAEQLQYIYNAAGLVSEIKSKGNTVVLFSYNDRGQRVLKSSIDPINENLTYTDVYVRDGAGTPMAIYRDREVIEHTVYGASRLGVFKRATNNTTYELTDHLGNVRALIEKDKQITGGTDYYPFGMPMPLRNSLSDYRYAYQGQEKDPETGKEAFELRLWDARIGRWLTTDPAGQYASPYLGMGNNPISRVDPDGGTDVVTHHNESPWDAHGGNDVFTFDLRYYDSNSSIGDKGYASEKNFVNADLKIYDTNLGIDIGSINLLQSNYGGRKLTGHFFNAGFDYKLGNDNFNIAVKSNYKAGSFEFTEFSFTPIHDVLTGKDGFYSSYGVGFSLFSHENKFDVSFGDLSIIGTYKKTYVSAHAGYEIGWIYDSVNNIHHIKGLGHLGWVVGRSFGLDVKLPGRYYQNAVYDAALDQPRFGSGYGF